MNNQVKGPLLNFFKKTKIKEQGQGKQIKDVSQPTSISSDKKKVDRDGTKVKINEALKDFSKIKKTAESTPNKNNADKIARLKKEIQSNQYKIDYDSLTDKIIENEF